MVRIGGIEAGSIADELQLEIGTRIVRINGQVVRDGIDLTYLLADPEVELETISPGGDPITYEVSRDGGDRMGIVPAPDKIRECANECVFCFIDGNPDHVRESLWLRDDDFRLSFTYGSYVTLTNLGPRGLQRLVDQRISPLYVSLHATEPAVRRRLLKNERAGEILDHLRFLTRRGLEVHTQVVLCPGWNDAEHLDRTIDELWNLGRAVRTLSIVPVGLTRYNVDRPVRLLTPDEAGRAVRQVERARARAHEKRGFGWVYAADEMFLIADDPIPAPAYYDDWMLLENGVGAVRRLLEDFELGLPDVPRLPGIRIRIVTGGSMAPFFHERAPGLAARTGARVETVDVANSFFGDTVSVAGLLAGEDILAALEGPAPGDSGDLVLLPADALNDDDRFIDDLALSTLRERLAPARVLVGREVTDVLRVAARDEAA